MKQNKAKPSIKFHSHGVKFRFDQKTRLKQFLVKLFEMENIPLNTLDYVFCSDEYLLQINRQFLQHDYHTDIITFPYSQEGEPIIGEIYISMDRVEENARDFKVNRNQELLRVIFHGALHLCGYLDKTTKEIELMRKKEDEYLGKWNTENGILKTEY